MGFELFLARVECENLIQMTSQTPHAECLEIIRSRASALQEKLVLDNASNGVVKKDEGACRHNFLFDSEPSLKPLESEISEREISERGSFLSEDKSILEMQKDYPDLAFRQRPIFKSLPDKLKRSRGRDGKPHPEMGGPCLINPHAEALEPGLEPGFSLTDLAQMMDKLELKELSGEEPLRCPVAETVQCEKNETMPILCSPSHESLCSITGCDSCSASDRLQQHHSITEPPQSFYIPSHVSGSAATPSAEQQEIIHSSSRAEAEPDLHYALEIL